MTNLADLFQGLPSAPLLSHVLLDPAEALRVGGIYRLDYEQALVITNDLWKQEAGGVPQHCFLIATAKAIAGKDIDDDEVLLLRVEKAAQLSQERDLLAVREDAMRDLLLAEGETVESLIDPYTRDRIQFSGLDCRVLGTFYEVMGNKKPEIEWGSDLDNFYASSRYRVYKPVGNTLSFIASYAKPDRRGSRTVPIGVVRYASTRRRAVAAGHAEAEVRIQIGDFVKQKTAMFGMTRMGKSNTMKTVATQVAIFAAETGTKIGQLLFDPAGEYANPNVQDNTALADIGPDHVRIYRYGATGKDPNVRPLGINFFDPRQIKMVQSTVTDALASDSDYVKAFNTADFAGEAIEGASPGDSISRAQNAARARLLLYASLVRAGYQVPDISRGPEGQQWPFRFGLPSKAMSQAMVEAIAADLPGSIYQSDQMKAAYRVAIERDRLLEVVEWILAHPGDSGASKGTLPRSLHSFQDGDAWKACLPVYTQRYGSMTVSGYVKLKTKALMSFHSVHAHGNFGNDIYQDLVAGRIVIVDLHFGPEQTIKELSEQIVRTILDYQNAVFADHKEPPFIQIFVEEAHVLFSGKRFKDDERDPWVRLAKEAAKFNIGLVYATQEVTGVDHSVLANTKNWVVAHLNNGDEVRTLSKFYDFAAFGESIVRAEDRGFVRLKTESCPFIVPVQVNVFGPSQINDARRALGISPLPFPVADQGSPQSPPAPGNGAAAAAEGDR